ncbi:unnamed protein product [Rhizophagus irregularis]|nr:unnamed protein product [Rhizophagus irregularis]
MPVQWFPAFWNLKQYKERKRFQAVVMDVPKSVTNDVVYNAANLAQSMLSQLDDALTFKIIQDHGQRKLIVYWLVWIKHSIQNSTLKNLKVFGLDIFRTP